MTDRFGDMGDTFCFLIEAESVDAVERKHREETRAAQSGNAGPGGVGKVA